MDKSDIVVGHSFIRRLRDHISPPYVPHIRGRDISESHPHVAAVAARSANLAHRVRRIYTSAEGINLISDLWKSESSIVSVRPKIALIHAGSNDFARMHQVNKGQAEAAANVVVAFAKQLVCDYGVEIVIFNSMVPWDSRNMNCDAPTFSANMAYFINILCDVAEHYKHLRFKHLRGFYKQKVNNKDMFLPFSTWSHDGIHCNPTYMAKYLQRLRFAIMNATSQES